MRDRERYLFHLRDFDVLHLVPGIDKAAVDEEAGFGPALNQRLDLAFDILLMLDGQQVKGRAADQVRAQLRDEQDRFRIGIVGHTCLLSVPQLRMATRAEAMRLNVNGSVGYSGHRF